MKMIKASDLRVGNKFKGIAGVQTVFEIIDNSRKGTIEYVSEYQKEGYKYIITCDENGNQYKPIEIEGVKLTKDWFKKFGLELRYGTPANSKAVYFDFSGFRIYLSDNGNSIHFNVDNSYFPELITIDYVHEFQNFYFAITKNDLKVLESVSTK